MQSMFGMIVVCGVALLVSACSTEQFEPSEMNFSRVELIQDRYEKEMSVVGLSASALENLAEDWQRHGDGPMAVSVLYDPKARINGPINAGRQASQIADSLRMRGVDVQGSALPVAGRGEELAALVSYPQTRARAPKGCGPMPGLDGTGPDFGKTGLNEGYRAGCGIEGILAQQIARPSDLRGRAGLKGPSDGRRVYQQTGSYRAGIPNEELEGEQASDN